jgi:hypothetical protein
MTNPNEVFKQFTAEVVEGFPALREILDQAKSGEMTEEDAMRCLAEVVQSDPALGLKLQQVAKQALAPLQVEEAAQPLEHGGLIMHKERGLPRLNPMVEASLIERMQFDGDIPELRTGGKPAKVRPAVAVHTDARNPVAIGMMLTTASDEVADKLIAKEPERQQLIGDMALLDMVEEQGTALATQEVRALVLDGKSDLMDVPEYRRGQVPAPLAVVQPSGATLLALTSQERKQNAWQFLSTTQGRRSAVSGIAELAETHLKRAGFDVTVRPFDATVRCSVLAVHRWSVNIDGPKATQAAFSLIDVAAAAIAKNLTRLVGQRRGRVVLEITTINTVDIRSVGWAGRLLAADPALEAPL